MYTHMFCQLMHIFPQFFGIFSFLATGPTLLVENQTTYEARVVNSRSHMIKITQK